MRLLLLLLILSLPALAQNDCDLGQVTDTTPLYYPPIARAAHISGVVLLRVSFKPTGEAEHIEVISGPKMLEPSASSYVQGWKASPYPGTRNCPIALEYVFSGASCDANPLFHAERIDAQRVRVEGYSVMFCDPSVEIGRVSIWTRLKRFFHPLRQIAE